MEETTKVGEFGDYTVFIVSDDTGTVPHFHIMDSISFKNKDQGEWLFHTCLEIRNPKYFSHNDIIAKDKIDEDLDDELTTFLKSEKLDNITYWRYLLILWNDNNSSKPVDYEIPVPDYASMFLDLKV